MFIPNCDKIVPGMLLAACRLNLPCIFISGGPMLPGKSAVTGGRIACPSSLSMMAPMQWAK